MRVMCASEAGRRGIDGQEVDTAVLRLPKPLEGGEWTAETVAPAQMHTPANPEQTGEVVVVSTNAYKQHNLLPRTEPG